MAIITEPRPSHYSDGQLFRMLCIVGHFFSFPINIRLCTTRAAIVLLLMEPVKVLTECTDPCCYGCVVQAQQPQYGGSSTLAPSTLDNHVSAGLLAVPRL